MIITHEPKYDLKKGRWVVEVVFVKHDEKSYPEFFTPELAKAFVKNMKRESK